MRSTTSRSSSPWASASASTSTSGPLIAFGSSPVAHPDAVLLERADDERVGFEAEAPRGRRRRGSSSTSGKRSSSIPIGIRCTRPAVDAGRDDEQLHLAMGHLDPVEPVGVAARATRSARRTPGSPASPGARGSTPSRAGATSRSRSGRAPRSGSCGRRPGAGCPAPTTAARARSRRRARRRRRTPPRRRAPSRARRRGRRDASDRASPASAVRRRRAQRSPARARRSAARRTLPFIGVARIAVRRGPRLASRERGDGSRDGVGTRHGVRRDAGPAGGGTIPRRRARPRPRRRRQPSALYTLLALAVGAPRVHPDEVRYLIAASSLVEGEGLTLRGADYGFGPAAGARARRRSSGSPGASTRRTTGSRPRTRCSSR